MSLTFESRYVYLLTALRLSEAGKADSIVKEGVSGAVT
jgi:hypothetical protein